MPGTVCLTFDLDAVSLWISSRRPSTPSAISRGEYGPEVGLPRILKLLARHSIEATFFIPGMVAELYPDSVRMIQDHGHELGTHGDTHDKLGGESRENERRILERGIDRLVKVSGEMPVGFRAPAWDLSFSTIENLAALGIRYDSSQFASDFQPYRARTGDRVEDGEWIRGEIGSIWEFPVAWELDDVPYFLVQPPGYPGGADPRVVGRIWQDELDYMVAYEPSGTFTLTMHPQVIGRGPRVLMLDRFIQHAKDQGCEFGTLRGRLDRLDGQ
nr:polysaccharide deacetylase [Rhodococcus sp. (in: high G+C Gram-positive bacteria)]